MSRTNHIDLALCYYLIVSTTQLISKVQTSQSSQVPRIALWRCSLGVFVFVFFSSSQVSSSLWWNVSKVTSLLVNSLFLWQPMACHIRSKIKRGSVSEWHWHLLSYWENSRIGIDTLIANISSLKKNFQTWSLAAEAKLQIQPRSLLNF